MKPVSTEAKQRTTTPKSSELEAMTHQSGGSTLLADLTADLVMAAVNRQDGPVTGAHDQP